MTQPKVLPKPGPGPGLACRLAARVHRPTPTQGKMQTPLGEHSGGQDERSQSSSPKPGFLPSLAPGRFPRHRHTARTGSALSLQGPRHRGRPARMARCAPPEAQQGHPASTESDDSTPLPGKAGTRRLERRTPGLLKDRPPPAGDDTAVCASDRPPPHRHHHQPDSGQNVESGRPTCPHLPPARWSLADRPWQHPPRAPSLGHL